MSELLGQTIQSRSESETLDVAERFAAGLKAGDVVCLQGGLGAGKTHFVKGIARGLGIDPREIHSPTFTLINEHAGRLPLYHFDCYRMKRFEEALEIGAEEYFYGEGVSVIEWPDRIKPLLPAEAQWITIESGKGTHRKITFGK